MPLRVLALAFLAALAPAWAADNPLPNPGFEEGEGEWTLDDNTSRVTADAARTGKSGLRVGADRYVAEGASVFSARFPAAPGQELSLSFWARSKASTCGVYLWFLNAEGKDTKDPDLKGGLPTRVVDQADGEWHRYTLEGKVPAGAAAFGIWVHTWAGATGLADLDDFEVSGVAPGAAPLPAPRKRSRPAPVVPAEMPARKAPPIIILKLDDVMQIRGHAHARWRELADYLASRRIKAGFGMVCRTLQEATPEYVKWVRDLRASGLIEFWFHGWDHATHREADGVYNEFSHRSYEEQRKRFDDSQKLALEKLGFAFETFGTPGGAYTGGAFDAETVRVMADEPHMKAWLYPQPLDEAGKKLEAGGKVTILDRVWDVNIEGAVGVPDCNRLMAGYAKHPDREYFVLQGHPAMWSPERFGEFARILDFLVAQKAVFMTPSEYVASKRPR